MAGSTVAGIITAIGTTMIAGGGLVTAVGVLVPILRGTKRNEEALRAQDSKLNVIHTLVNSTLTAALQAQLDSSRRELAMMEELISRQQRDGEQITDNQKATMGALQKTIDDLSVAMKDREAQTRSANIQIANESARSK